MKKRTWKRIEPGHYSSPPFEIVGAGTSWELLRDNVGVSFASSKGDLQAMVDKDPNIGKKEPEPEVKVARFSGKDSLESVLAAFRMEVGRLTDMIGVLSTKIDQIHPKK